MVVVGRKPLQGCWSVSDTSCALDWVDGGVNCGAETNPTKVLRKSPLLTIACETGWNLLTLGVLVRQLPEEPGKRGCAGRMVMLEDGYSLRSWRMRKMGRLPVEEDEESDGNGGRVECHEQHG